MVSILLDENVSLDLAAWLRKNSYPVHCIVESRHRGMSDKDVWELARKQQSILITRDYHFTNPARFSPNEIFAIIYIRHGNLRSQEEVQRVKNFLSFHPEKEFQGKLVTLSKYDITIR